LKVPPYDISTIMRTAALGDWMREDGFSYAHLGNVSFLEDLYQKYCEDPNSIDASWRYFFSGMEFSRAAPLQKQTESEDLRVYHLIVAYRKYGHKMAKFNPLSTEDPAPAPELDLSTLGFQKEELSKTFPTCGFLKEASAPLSTIMDALKATYCKSVGIEYMGMGAELEKWVQSKIEPYFPLPLSKEDRLNIMHSLNRAELFESFVHTKYVGQTRFSLEGGETLIPLLAFMIEQAAEEGVEEVMIGMAHRGRLNVLANILNKSYAQIFREFEDHASDTYEGSGDVKYHKGAHSHVKTRSGKFVEVGLAANPSHLESVNPVVEGEVRARQELKKDPMAHKKVVPLLIHGDASIAGQGVIYETLQFFRLKGYSTGGTIHIVVNNQIGYTTLPTDSRSTRYCTDIARSFGCPVFHVNAENPEECITAGLLAMQIRQRFHCDVFIDLNCYRKYGHNEGDEPTFTQPLEYKKIKQKQSIREVFKNQLIQEGILTGQQAQELEETFKQNLHDTLNTVISNRKELREIPIFDEKNISLEANVPLIASDRLIALSEAFCAIPDGFQIHPKLQKLLKDRLAMVKEKSEEKHIDWGMGEMLAYASLVVEGIHVRLSGQDCERGTFSHRHAVWVDQETSEKYTPLSHLDKNQASFAVFNSPLSEFGVLGFDLGYSIAYPKSLTLWEAQFGDFANGAQVMIDQYIATSEQKWSNRSNITLLLPHGYEGKGPEHSSARLERFLQLCGEGNMIIANCTTPAQLYHLLRRQGHLVNKKPLVVFTPKALLRHPLCTSNLQEFSQGRFQAVMDDPAPPSDPKKIILCSGKVFYDLLQEREKRKDSSCVILRIEQLYPFFREDCKELLKKYGKARSYFWVQEEHQNMGAWNYIRPLLQDLLEGQVVQYIGRSISASPAAGSYALHKKQYEQFMEQVFKG
jgi:2-oxoglutarate dehydrogenase E1 component